MEKPLEANICEERMPKVESSLNLVSLSADLHVAERSFKASQSKQGYLGNSYDWIKNNLGGSSEGSWMGRQWSNVINYDNGSEAINKKLGEARQALIAGDSGKVAELTKTVNGKTGLKIAEFASKYDDDQRMGVSVLADAATIGALMISRGRGNTSGLISHAAHGAFVKAAIKGTDGAYSNIKDDAATGAFIGVTIPYAALMGRTFGRAAVHGLSDSAKPVLSAGLQNRVTSAVGSGAEGAILGLSQQLTAGYEQHRASGLSADKASALSLRDAMNNPVGAYYGAGLGVLAGFALPKLARPGDHSPHIQPDTPPPVNPIQPSGRAGAAAADARVITPREPGPKGPDSPAGPSRPDISPGASAAGAALFESGPILPGGGPAMRQIKLKEMPLPSDAAKADGIIKPGIAADSRISNIVAIGEGGLENAKFYTEVVGRLFPDDQNLRSAGFRYLMHKAGVEGYASLPARDAQLIESASKGMTKMLDELVNARRAVVSR